MQEKIFKCIKKVSKILDASSVAQSCLTLCGLFVALQPVARQAPPSIGFFRQKYWGEFPPPGDLPNPGIKTTSPALAG